MAFVTYKDNDGEREVVGVYLMQQGATDAAATDPNLTAHTGNVNDNVMPGDFITRSGTLLSAPPSRIRDKLIGPEHRTQIQEAFRIYLAGRPVWVPSAGTTNDQTALQAADKWAIMSAALADQIVEGNYLSGRSITRSTREDFIEHIVKFLRDDPRAAYNRLRNSKTNRDAWAAVNIAGGQVIQSDMVTGTLGQPQDPDGSLTAVTGVAVPSKFDPSQPGLRRP